MRFTIVIWLTKTNVPSCFIINGNELKWSQNRSWHDFATYHTTSGISLFVLLYLLVWYKTHDRIHCESCALGILGSLRESFGDHLARIANDSLKLVREQVEFHIDWLHIFSGRAHLVLNGDLVKRKLVRHDDMFCVSSMKKGMRGNEV